VTKGDAYALFTYLREKVLAWNYDMIRSALDYLAMLGHPDLYKGTVINALTLLLDRRYPLGRKRRRSILQMLNASLDGMFQATPPIEEAEVGSYVRIQYEDRGKLRAPHRTERVLVVDAKEFPPEGDDCHSRLVTEAYLLGWRHFIAFGHKGQRFLGCALGPHTKDVRIDAYGSTGDYLASGIDGLEIYVHGNAQDQLGQILKSGKLVVYGDVGQTFMYGAKGGEVYVLGNAAGRPLINAAGKPRVVINGTALDFLAESFMAGDPLKGGGFVVLNGLAVDDDGKVAPFPTPYPGSNLFSLASGGAIFVRDPHRKLVPEQLNGGEFRDFTTEDWQLILPYLEENERLFGISIDDDLLTVNGVKRKPSEVYRTIRAVKLAVLTGKMAEASLEEWGED
jgi:glutamate synthase domain-containing protein 3